MKVHATPLLALFLLALGTYTPVARAAGPAAPANITRPATITRVVIQMSDNDPQKWNLALNNARNIQSALGDVNTVIEVVAYGPGIYMLKKGSPVSSRVAEASLAGIQLKACQNTMRSLKLAPENMLAEAGYVPAGVVEIIQRQQQGYAYIRP